MNVVTTAKKKYSLFNDEFIRMLRSISIWFASLGHRQIATKKKRMLAIRTVQSSRSSLLFSVFFSFLSNYVVGAGWRRKSFVRLVKMRACVRERANAQEERTMKMKRGHQNAAYLSDMRLRAASSILLEDNLSIDLSSLCFYCQANKENNH